MRRLQTLFLGNGINLAYGGLSWDHLLQEISVRKDIDVKDLRSPMPLKAILVTNNQIDQAFKGKDINMFGKINTDQQMEAIQRLLKMNFDHILTTNYSYEFEMAALNQKEVKTSSIKKMMKSYKEHPETKYLIQTCNQVEYHGHLQNIWHVHGEARKLNSMILGHYYYGNLLGRIQDYCDQYSSKYKRKQDKGDEIPVKSWIDAFLLGDVYILGFGFAQSEFDLWWLLNRRKNEKADHGKVYFFEPEWPGFDEKQELLKILKVDVESCGVKMPDKSQHSEEEYIMLRNQCYSEFYSKALDRIEELKKENSQQS